MRRGLSLIVLASVFVSQIALADAEDDAAAAYDRGAAAYDRGDFGTAASELARADALGPNDVTLELALTAVARTDDAVLGMTLVERAESRPRPSKRLLAATDAARKRFAAMVGKIDVVCAVDPPCEAAFDGTPIAPNRATIVVVGPHRVTIARSGTRETHDVTIEAGKTVELIATVAPPPAPTPTLTVEPSRGVRPVWFWVATGVTVAVAAATALSALDTASTYDEFSSDRSNVDLANAGRSAERRTVALGVTSGVLAVGTVVLGVFLIDWHPSSTSVARWTF
jgi:hypothetical protein